MPDHLPLICYFAKHSAESMRLSCSPHISLPPIRKVYNVIKGPFVHAKKKELFQQTSHRAVVQLFDCSMGEMQAWMGYVNGKLPAGVRMDVSLYAWYESMQTAVKDAQPDILKDEEKYDVSLREGVKSFEDSVLEKKALLIARLSK